jgi:ribonuclease J
VVADFGLRHVERLVTFLKVAEATGRKLVILPKDAYLLYAMGFAGKDQFIPQIDNGNIVIYWEFQNVTATWQKMIQDKFGHLAVRPQDIAQNQDQFICCFSFFDVNELAYIRPKPGSKWIYSSNEAFSEDLKIDFDRLGNWVEKFGMEFPGDPRVEEPGKPPKSPYHVSGHACKDDLLKVVRTIAPKELIPVHSTSPEDYVELLQGVCKVTLPERGVTIPI